MSEQAVIAEALRTYVPDGFRDDDGIWHEGPHLKAVLACLAGLVQERDDAVKQIRSDHAYTASVAGRPCACEWCVA